MTIFNVGVSGLNAAQMGMLTTGHNVSNASTVGYSRQQIVQSTNTPMFTGAGYLGQGTNVKTVMRVYNQFLTGQVLSAETGVAEMDSYLAQIKQIDNLLADAEAGLTPALAEFFKAVQETAANPASIPARQTLLAQSQALVARFQAIDARLTEIRDGTNQQISSTVVEINELARQLGEINQRILDAEASSMNQPPNDLLDQRDQVVAELNKLIRVQVARQDNGVYNAFIGNGQALVVGSQSYSLAPVQSPYDPERIGVALTTPLGVKVDLLDSLLTGGKLGGLIAFRNGLLDEAQNALGRVAVGLAQQFNELHRLGQDLDGALGGDFFSYSGPNVKGSNLNASAATVVTASFVFSDYRVEYDGTNYQITRLSDGTTTTSATLPAVVDGVRIVLASGTPAAGDVFLVRPNELAGKRVIAESDNTGTAVLDSTAANVQALGTSDYRLDYIAANQFRLTRLSDNATWTGTGATPQGALDDLATQIQTGFSLAISGTPPTVGDSFLIEPTRSGAKNIAVVATLPQTIAAAAPIRTAAALTNSGTAKISAGEVLDRSYLPLTSTITLTFNAALNQFTVAGAVPAVGPIAYNPAVDTEKTISFNGLSFTIAGRLADGDSFTIERNLNGVADNRTMQRLGALQTKNTLAATAYDANSPSAMTAAFTRSATAGYQAAYAQIVSRVGAKTREIEVAGKTQQTLYEQAEAARQKISGVNLDEEAANLLRYQQAYQAAARMLDVATRLFDEILALGR